MNRALRILIMLMVAVFLIVVSNYEKRLEESRLTIEDQTLIINYYEGQLHKMRDK